MSQPGDLFGAPPPEPQPAPDGLRYQPALLDPAEQASLVADLETLPFAPFEFQGWLGARRIVSFGLSYDFTRERLDPAEPLPDFLHPLRDRAAAFAGLAPGALAQTLINEYRPGAGIGWHRDRPHYDKVIGVSLGAPCVMRLRQKDGEGWRRRKLPLAPGSVYLLDGPARRDWEHSITPLEALRYSVTFRTLREGTPFRA